MKQESLQETTKKNCIQILFFSQDNEQILEKVGKETTIH